MSCHYLQTRLNFKAVFMTEGWHCTKFHKFTFGKLPNCVGIIIIRKLNRCDLRWQRKLICLRIPILLISRQYFFPLKILLEIKATIYLKYSSKTFMFDSMTLVSFLTTLSFFLSFFLFLFFFFFFFFLSFFLSFSFLL